MLLLAGQRLAGLVAAASGTALALLDQKETLRSWWNLLPGFIDDVQRVLGQVQGGVEDIAAKRETLRQILAK
jgi:ABC-type transporter Mla subunit MlaD